MRLVKFFPGAGSIDKNINAWVRMAPQQRCILQISPYKEGVLVLYERYASEKDEWADARRSFAKTAVK